MSRLPTTREILCFFCSPGKSVCDDLLGQWSAEKHQPEVPRLMNILSKWKQMHQGREVMILGGDVHEGGS